jgi:hypothetical protein
MHVTFAYQCSLGMGGQAGYSYITKRPEVTVSQLGYQRSSPFIIQETKLRNHKVVRDKRQPKTYPRVYSNLIREVETSHLQSDGEREENNL